MNTTLKPCSCIGEFVARTKLMCLAQLGGLVLCLTSWAAGPETLVLRRQMVYDENAQLDAFSMLVPQGWKIDSKITWQLGRLDPAHAFVRVYNPDGVESYASYGGIWMFVDWSTLGMKVPEGTIRDNILVHRMYASPAEFVMHFAIENMGGELQRAKLEEVKEMPELADAVVAPLRRNPGPQGALTARVNRLRFEYYVRGIPVEEDVYCTICTNAHPENGFVNWSAHLVSVRAAKGQMKEKIGLLRTVATSTRLTLPWFATICAVQRQALELERLALNAERQRAAIVLEARQVTAEKYRSSFEKQGTAASEVNQGWDQVIRGVETKYDPIHKHCVEIPLGYQHAWVNPLGETILSNNGTYNPGGNFQSLEAPPRG